MSLEREEGFERLGWDLLSCDPNFNQPPIWTRLMNTFDEQLAKSSLRRIQKAILSFVLQRSMVYARLVVRAHRA
jgi:hypothetical protein